MGLIDDVPEVLTWQEKPDIEVGDKIVFSEYRTHIDANTIRWAERHEGEDRLTRPTKLTKSEPSEYLEITHVGRHKRGHWFARFIVKGADKLEYMARTSGTTTSQQISIDKDAPILHMPVTEDNERKNVELREKQRLIATKRALLEQLTKTSSPGAMARLTLSIGDIDAKLKRIEAVNYQKAA